MKRRKPYSKFKAREKAQALLLLMNGHTILHICELLGIDYSTFMRAKQSDQDFARAVEDVMRARDQLVEDALYQKALSGDVAACKFWLINRAKTRWKSENAVQVDKGDITIRIIKVSGVETDGSESDT